MIPLVQWRKLEDQFKTETLKRGMSEYTKYNSPTIAKAEFVHPLSKGENF